MLKPDDLARPVPRPRAPQIEYDPWPSRPHDADDYDWPDAPGPDGWNAFKRRYGISLAWQMLGWSAVVACVVIVAAMVWSFV